MSSQIPTKMRRCASKSPKQNTKVGNIRRTRHQSSDAKVKQQNTKSNTQPVRSRHQSSDSATGTRNPTRHSHMYGSKRLDLQQENTELKSKLKILEADYEKRLQDIGKSLSHTQEKYNELEINMTEKENQFCETLAELRRKNEGLESNLEEYQKKLVLLSIDPVTLKPMKQDSYSSCVEEKRLQAKDRVEKFREHLKTINVQTSTQIRELQNLRQQLDRKK